MTTRTILAATAVLALAVAGCSSSADTAPRTPAAQVDCSDRSLSQAEWVAACAASAQQSPPPSSQPQPEPQTLTEGSSITVTATLAAYESAPPITAKLTLHELVTTASAHNANPDDALVNVVELEPKRGQFVAMRLTIENVGQNRAVWLPNPYFIASDGKKTTNLGPSNWIYVEGIGGTHDGPAMDDLELAPGQYAEGAWILDVPDAKGVIVIEDNFGRPVVEIPVQPLEG